MAKKLAEEEVDINTKIVEELSSKANPSELLGRGGGPLGICDLAIGGEVPPPQRKYLSCESIGGHTPTTGKTKGNPTNVACGSSRH